MTKKPVESMEVALSDCKISGKERPWRVNKLASSLIANLLLKEIAPFNSTTRFAKKGERIAGCADTITFKLLPNGSKRLHQVFFCKDRFCPMCMWRRTLKNAYTLDKVLQKLLDSRPKIRFLFVTLTVKNVVGNELKEAIQQLSRSFNILVGYEDIKRYLIGFYRSTEVTQTNDDGTYHPHIHVLIAVKPSYFAHGYVSHDTWTSLWQRALKADYTPIVHVQAIRKNGKHTLAETVREVAKYATKSSDILRGTVDEQAAKLETIIGALSGARLYGYGGKMKDIHKLLQIDEEGADTEDLVNVDGDAQQIEDISSVTLEVYKWFVAGRNYFKQG